MGFYDIRITPISIYVDTDFDWEISILELDRMTWNRSLFSLSKFDGDYRLEMFFIRIYQQ